MAKWEIGAGVIAILAVATVLTAGAAGVGVGAVFAAGFAGSAIGVGASGLAVTIAGSAFAGVKFDTIGVSYSVGVISNYENEGDYAGPFTDMGGGYLVVIDHCFDPTKYYDVST